MIPFLKALSWSTCTEFPLDRQSTRNAMLGLQGSSGRHFIGRGQQSSNRVSVISSRTMHQSTTPYLSQTIWPRWASRQLLILPIVQTLLPVTSGFSLHSWKNSEAVNMRQLWRWKRLWHVHTRGLPWDLPEVVGTVQQVYCSRRKLLRREIEFHVCHINKRSHTKKVGNLI